MVPFNDDNKWRRWWERFKNITRCSPWSWDQQTSRHSLRTVREPSICGSFGYSLDWPIAVDVSYILLLRIVGATLMVGPATWHSSAGYQNHRTTCCAWYLQKDVDLSRFKRYARGVLWRAWYVGVRFGMLLWYVRLGTVCRTVRWFGTSGWVHCQYTVRCSGTVWWYSGTVHRNHGTPPPYHLNVPKIWLWKVQIWLSKMQNWLSKVQNWLWKLSKFWYACWGTVCPCAVPPYRTSVPTAPYHCTHRTVPAYRPHRTIVPTVPHQRTHCTVPYPVPMNSLHVGSAPPYPPPSEHISWT